VSLRQRKKVQKLLPAKINRSNSPEVPASTLFRKNQEKLPALLATLLDGCGYFQSVRYSISCRTLYISDKSIHFVIHVLIFPI
jgi:hypothetical protein